MKRQRGRGRKSNGGGHHHHHHQNRNFESNGPDVKIRGSASTVYEKYQQLARDAASSGDRVAAESYLQHAEHYFRMMRSQQQHQQQNQQHNQQQNPQGQQNRPDDIGNRDFGGGYGNGRDDFDDTPGPADVAIAPQPAVAASPLDVVDPEAVEASGGQPQQRDDRGGDDMRGGRRRRRRRYEGGGQPSGPGDIGGEAAEADSPTFDNA